MSSKQIVLVFSVCCLSAAVYAIDLPLWLDDVTLRVGQTRRVALRLAPGTRVQTLSLDVEVWFAPEGIAVSGVEVAPALSACAVGSTVDDKAGTMRIAGACVTPREMAGPLLWLTVRGVTSGRSLLSVRACQMEALRDGRGVELGCRGYGGRVCVQ